MSEGGGDGRGTGATLPLVLDWDGTVTETDTLRLVIGRYGDPDVLRSLGSEIARSSVTLREVIVRQVETVRASLPEVVDWLVQTVSLRTGFAALVERHDPLIVSAGFHELIDPLLERDGIRARVVANHVVADPAGWQARFPPAEPCAVCGEPCKRAAVSGLHPFTFVGDGFSDRCVSLAAERVFARDGLAAWLDAQGAPYATYDDLTDVLDAL
jgi:2-hydroxy-3-keto-5-methylthiopentenyl-1-phosphate phosphatase